MEPNLNGMDCFKSFIDLHKFQLQSSSVPEIFWESLYNKLKHGVFDAGDSFRLVRVEQDEDDDEVETNQWFNSWKVLTTADVSSSDPKHIYLIDHAWTFRPSQAKPHLETIDGLLPRMCELMGVDYESDQRDNSAENVMKQMWKYCLTYSIGNLQLEAEDRVPIWYIMDEFGSRIQHSDIPNFRLIPFYFVTEETCFSLLFPICDVASEQEVTRDFIEGAINNEVMRSALLSPWSDDFLRKYASYMNLQQREPESDYFRSSRVNETLPNPDAEVIDLPQDRPIRTYVEYSFIRDFLNHPRFQLVDTEEEGEILWLASHFKKFRELSDDSPGKRINQFPCEHLLTVKDLLAVVSRRAAKVSLLNMDTLETLPNWLPTTFNLKTELPQFIAFFIARQEKGLSNLWIVKPFNLARSLDTHITDNLDFITRLAISGPKVVQRYVDRPVLFHRQDIDARVKFDIRYIILLRSTNPLKAYVYRRFWLRFANKPYELNNFHEYERHFTVMNYSPTNLHQMFCHDFIRYFEEQNPDQKWEKIERKIFDMLSELLHAAVKGKDPHSFLMHNPQSRAMYAVDLMLKYSDSNPDENGTSIQPQLLEVNWAPDCKRACAYYPEFFNDIFSVLFLDDVDGKHVEPL